MYKKCIDCPFHRIVEDPDLYDSWNADDEAIVCTKTPKVADPNSKYPVDRLPYQARPYQTKNVEVPNWCPISVSTKRDEKIKNILND